MSITAEQVSLDAILDLREAYRREMDCQIVHDSWHARGFTDAYLLRVAGEVVGYGSVGGAPGDARDTVKELFVVPGHRGRAHALFRALVAASGARAIEAQTNDVLLSLMLFDAATDLSSETILFADGTTTHLPAHGAVLRRVAEGERAGVFAHTSEPVGDWGLEVGGRIAATGGVLYHYNPPYGDIFMEVAGEYQRRGFGSYLVQELKRICREAGRVPAARCHRNNHASQRTLERAGMTSCACIVRGRLDGGAAGS